MKEQSWRRFAQTGDPMHYLEYAKSRMFRLNMGEALIEKGENEND